MHFGVTTERKDFNLNIDAAGLLENQSDRHHVVSHEGRVAGAMLRRSIAPVRVQNLREIDSSTLRGAPSST